MIGIEHWGGRSMTSTTKSRRRAFSGTAAVLAALCVCAGATAREGSAFTVPAHGVIGVDAPQLTPEFWIARLAEPDKVLLDAGQIAAHNEHLQRVDATMHDLRTLPATHSRQQISEQIRALSERPSHELFDTQGNPIPAKTIDALIDNLALPAIVETQTTRYGLVVQRADLRTFPTALRVFSTRGDTDIDRFQESALFPGTPVAILHESGDHWWWFVVSPRYAAWVEKKYIAEGSAAQVFDYVNKKPYRIVTGANVATVFTPEQPALSQLRLDMSVRVPLLSDWPADKTVNGQHPYTSYVIQLPLRGDDGALHLAPALLQKNADTSEDYLPLTQANIVRQTFKFLGERYGWGHAYGTRDCSGFVSDVYRSMGVDMPRNTRDQSVSAGLDHRLFGARDDRTARIAAAHALQVGDLVYIPGHVMMAIGSIDGEPYVIHDTSGLSYRGRDGKKVRVDLNEVSVSPLTPLLFNDKQTYIDRMTSIVHPTKAQTP
jgi:cell wall-associated NlpC family hydrolase